MYQTNGIEGAINRVTDPGSVAARRGGSASSAFSYDYLTVEINEKFAMEVVDAYEALGFELVKNERALSLKVALTFKRDRKIQNKEQLKKVQVKLAEIFKNINDFEFNKTTVPFAASMAVGIPGILAFGGGMCLCLLVGGIGGLIGGVALGLGGLGIMGLGYLVYKKLNAKKTTQMNGLIDMKHDEISTLCEEAQKYLK